MVIDTSAIVAIAFNKPEAELYEQKIVDATRRFISLRQFLSYLSSLRRASARPGPRNLIYGYLKLVWRSLRSI